MEGQGGFLQRLARLHPGLMWLLCFATALIASGLDGSPKTAGSLLSNSIGLLTFLLWASYPLFVVALLSEKPATSPVRLKRAIAAFAFVGVSGVVLFVFSYLTRSGIFEFPPGVQQNLSVFVVPVFAALFYLWGAASAQLVEAERGLNYSWLQVFGAWLLFFYLLFFGVYFLHRRVRRLVRDHESVGPFANDLPLEALAIREQAGGHLSLLLTERISWKDFDDYAAELLHRLNGKAAKKGSSVDMHIWNVDVKSLPFRLVYDDFPNGVTLESVSHAGDVLLREMQKRLLSAQRAEEAGPPRSEAARASERVGEA